MQVNLFSQPFTADPYEYDYFTHHAVFRSIYSTLVTQYGLGGIKPSLAEKWESDKDFKNWSFKIRNDLKYDNGDAITPVSIIRSLKRIAYLQKKNNSSSLLFGSMEGLDKFHKIDDELTGLHSTGDTIFFRFNKSFSNFLEVVSFGLYGVVHESNFDNNGKWINSKKIIGSSGYRIKNWDDYEIILELRKDFPIRDAHLKRFEFINFNWSLEKKINSDLVLSTSLENELVDMNFHGPIPSGIFYFRCQSWMKKNGVLTNITNRKFLREQFYAELNKTRIKPIRSFFPLAMAGIKEAQTKKINYDGNLIKDKTIVYGFDAKRPSEIESSLKKAIESTGIVFNSKKILLKDAYSSINNFLTPSFDGYIMGTGILVDSPNDDIRFMFMSKEGIQLPDIDGRIINELKKESFSSQLINELIWDQAVIWPITHYSFGFWAKNFVDFSLLNTVQPPADFNFIGKND